MEVAQSEPGGPTLSQSSDCSQAAHSKSFKAQLREHQRSRTPSGDGSDRKPGSCCSCRSNGGRCGGAQLYGCRTRQWDSYDFDPVGLELQFDLVDFDILELVQLHTHHLLRRLGRCHVGRVVISMPLQETLPLTPATAQWEVWSTTARLVLTDAGLLEPARDIANRKLSAVDVACSRFRADSELATLPAGRPVEVSPLLASLVAAALDAAEATDGLVSPTLGNALASLGYDRDWTLMDGDRPAAGLRVRPAPSWRKVRLDRQQLTVPSGVRLDLGATGKAFTADLIAAQIAAELGVGVLMALGGDIATAGPTPDDGWHVLVQDQPGDPSVVVVLPPGGAIATSSIQGRRWRSGGAQLHHILDPRNCRPAPVVWRTATVAAGSCVRANALTTAALVLGSEAPGWLREQGHAARLVSAADPPSVVNLAGFPAPLEEGTR